MIAMAISCHPSLLICDEPTTALDVRVQKTILDLLKELRRSENIGMIFITHDLGLVADMADRALVMLKGQVVESGKVKALFTNPQHPYTQGAADVPARVAYKRTKASRCIGLSRTVERRKEIPNSETESKNYDRVLRFKGKDILIKIRGIRVRFPI